MKLTFLESFDDLKEPERGVETGLADIIISSINKKWDSIRDLNSILVMLNDTGYEEYAPVIEEILETENNHIGKLHHIVELLTPVTSNIEDGKQEAEEII